MRHSPAVDDIELAQRLQKRRVQQRSATDLPAVVLLAVLFAQSRRTADGVAIDVERHDRRTELPRRQAEQSAPAPCIEKSPTLQIVGLQQLPHRLLSLLDPVRVEQPEKTSPVSSELKVVRPITGHGGGCRVVRQFSPVCRAIRRNGVAENRDPICVWRVRGSVNCGWRSEPPGPPLTQRRTSDSGLVVGPSGGIHLLHREAPALSCRATPPGRGVWSRGRPAERRSRLPALPQAAVGYGESRQVTNPRIDRRMPVS